MAAARTDSTEAQTFQRILSRNFSLPIAAGTLSAAVFIALIYYLVTTLGWVEHTSKVIGQAYYSNKLFVEAETGLRGYVITGRDSFLQPHHDALTQFPASLAMLRQMVSDNPAQLGRLQRIENLYGRWNAYAADVLAEERKSGDAEALVRSERGKAIADALRDEYQVFVRMEENLRAERSGRASDVAIAAVIAVLILMALLGGMLIVTGRRQLLQLSRAYAEALERQALQNEALQQQDWLKTGQAELAGQLLGQQPVSQLCERSLGHVARYVGAAAGALYFCADELLFRREASYALDAAADDERTEFAWGEGLAGQAAIDAQLLRLDDVPPGYLAISSGLGRSEPAHLLIVPLLADGTVIGVLELGLLHRPESRDETFLALAADAIGMALKAAQYRHKLRETLEETQQLNEELQTQQEELRTANEELEEQSQAMREVQVRLENQQFELEQNNARLDEQAQRLLQQRDHLDARNQALDATRSELERKTRELQRLSEYKSEFLANMSHELRTPLNSALIFARLLADNPNGNLDAEQVRYASLIAAAGSDLLNLINDILDLSKVEAGMLEVHPEPTLIREVVDHTAALFRSLAEQKRLQFETKIDAEVPRLIETDGLRLRQILKNLLSNAIKFTERGFIRLQVWKVESGVAFEVLDSGIGIPADQQEAIFEAFRQADGATNRQYGGTGLGLSISRDLARLLGGQIQLRSRPGEGSNFVLILPLAMPPRPALPAPAAEAGPADAHAAALRTETVAEAESRTRGLPPLPEPAPAPPPRQAARDFADDRDALPPQGRTMLVIEDDTPFAQVLVELAHSHDFHCLVALNAADGMLLARQYRPDAIVLDMKLPDYSGMTVLEQLKEDPATRHIPIYVVSGVDRSDTALYMGAFGYLVKPAEQQALQAMFDRLENKLAQKIKRVLVVEDDPLQRESIRLLIGGTQDVEIVDVALAEEALAALRQQPFDCMVMDLSLPDMPGHALLERMGEEPLRAFPPVIVYTGRNLGRDEEEILRRYSQSIIIKGARSPERLLDEVTLFLHQVETELPPERQKMLRVVRSRDKALEGIRVLLVDDDVRNVFALTSALESHGAKVEITRNGREAVDFVQARGETLDVVLMDIMMPVMDGYTAIAEIRKDERFRHLPIIAVTAKAMKDDQERCLAAGANDYLAKPVDLDGLLSLVRVWVSKPRRPR